MSKNHKKQVNTNARSRTHFIVAYIDKQTALNILEKNLSIINRYAMIYHDRDVYENGSPKEPHCHIWLNFENKKSIKQVCDMFYTFDESKQKPCTILSELCDNNHYAQRYLLHLDHSEKAQYDIEEVAYYNVNLDHIYDSNSHAGSWEVEALERLVNGENKLDLAREYGRDFIYHYHQYKRLAEDIIEDVIRQDIEARALNCE